jgi:hypothetical protein
MGGKRKREREREIYVFRNLATRERSSPNGNELSSFGKINWSQLTHRLRVHVYHSSSLGIVPPARKI